MKKLFLVLLIQLIAVAGFTQAIKRLAARAGRKVENKIGQKVEKQIDDVADGKATKKSDSQKTTDTPKKSDTSKKSPTNKSEETTNENSSSAVESKSSASEKGTTETSSSIEPESLEAYSKFDFIPGEKVLTKEEFAGDAIGDFPVHWNTNASGEVVKLSSKEGKWFKLNKAGIFHPEQFKQLPENFTLEFDLGVNNEFNFYSTEFNLALTKMADAKQMNYRPSHSVNLIIHPLDASLKKARSQLITMENGKQLMQNKVAINTWQPKTRNFVHVSIWRQKQRLRVYVNEEKIWDIPRAFDAEQVYDALVLHTDNFYRPEDYYVLSNLVLAVGAPDTRNKLMNEGKFVTTGILFSVNSDHIQPQSFGVMKEIAAVLQENPELKIKIIGHTDSDGDSKKNLDLSKRRALSVKKSLVSNFGISEARLETDGKGATQPVAKNDTNEGKANNRRVEFIKQ